MERIILSNRINKKSGQKTPENAVSPYSVRLSAIRKADPFFQRETEKYGGHPLPSREYILQCLTDAGTPLSFDRLCDLLDIAEVERELFQRRLGAMRRDGQLMQNRRADWLMPDKAHLVRGRVVGHADGFGFLVPDDAGAGKATDKKQDIFLPEKEMRELLHGDRALVRIAGTDRRGRPEGKLVEVLERANSRIVGRVMCEHGVWFVVPENKRIAQDVLLVPAEEKASAKVATKSDSKAATKSTRSRKITWVDGQIVMVELTEQPTRHSQPIGKVVEVLGNFADPGMEIEVALRSHELPHEFSKATITQVARIADEVKEQDKKGRIDVRALPLVTIDGETAKDFDDAVYCERIGGAASGRSAAGLAKSARAAVSRIANKLTGKQGAKQSVQTEAAFRLVVAIADVSHYVKPGTALDEDAYERGNSVYFPRRVIPMLPEKLSNGLCSLNPQVDRLCMVCDMQITAQGEIVQHDFYPAVMNSKARLTYTEVAAALFEGDAAVRKKLKPLLPHLEALDELFRILLKAREARGAIDFETIETVMQFDDQGKISRIVPYERNDAHRIIEECMLAANVCASRYLHDHQQTLLYRIHAGPSSDRLQRLREFLAGFGLQLGGGDAPTAKDFAKLMEQVKPRPDRQLLQTMMLRSLKQAVYSPDNAGHFGLAYEHYAHFTSPIRRYPDLLVHRAIKAVLAKKKYEVEEARGGWDTVGMHCSMTERRADEATRDVESWLKCYFMQDRVGEEFEGSVSAVVPFGIFVTLDDVFVEGLVHIFDLGQDYFHFDEKQHALVGERSGVRYRLADRVSVQLVRVDIDNRKIDFRLLEGLPKGAASSGKRRKSTPQLMPKSISKAAPKSSHVKSAPPVNDASDESDDSRPDWYGMQGMGDKKRQPGKSRIEATADSERSTGKQGAKPGEQVSKRIGKKSSKVSSAKSTSKPPAKRSVASATKPSHGKVGKTQSAKKPAKAADSTTRKKA